MVILIHTIFITTLFLILKYFTFLEIYGTVHNDNIDIVLFNLNTTGEVGEIFAAALFIYVNVISVCGK